LNSTITKYTKLEKSISKLKFGFEDFMRRKIETPKRKNQLLWTYISNENKSKTVDQ